MTTLITSQLVQAIRSEFRLDWRGIHGAGHWARVRANGLTIAAANGANKGVIEYFAFLHDACRRTDGRDHGHGLRAASFARSIRQDFIRLADDEFDLLMAAIEGHTHSLDHDDLTVLSCWDADRLDLPRIGIMPDPERLCTDVGRQLSALRDGNHHIMQVTQTSYIRYRKGV
ncbi:MAG: hypothetical protein IPM03_18690 [Sulfuritalea sp.]|nr:hypothetical protein [Sulfuritalea sp.]